MKPVSCINPGGKGSYGGSQMWFQDKVLINSGCGIIAGLDSLLHLMGTEEIDKDSYLELMDEASGFIKPIRLPFKIKPVMIAGQEFLGSFGLTMPRLKRGLKRMARARGLNIRLRSFTFGYMKKLKAALDRGIPVIMLVRAPLNNVTLIADTEGFSSETIGQHFVTVTDLDEENGFLTVSSWGRRYKIDCKDLDKFCVTASFCYIDPQKPDNA